MVVQSTCDFATNATSPAISKEFFNFQGSILALQIDGGAGEYYIEGRPAKDKEWTPIAGIKMSDLSVARGVFKDPGAYELDIIGARQLRCRIAAVDGSVNISGQIISTEEQ